MAHPDICVIGGGPAGLTAAIALRLTGASVAVFDANEPPIDKACGEGLLPDTLAAFRELGIHIPVEEGYRVRGIRFVHAHSRAEANFRTGHAIGLRRTVLHDILVKRASNLGIDLHWRVNAAWLEAGRVTTPFESFHPKLTIGADGRHSNVRASAGLSAAVKEKRRYGFRRHYAVAPWTDYVEVYWAKHCQIYITPVSPEAVGVALLTCDPRQRLDHALPLFPALAQKLDGAKPVTRELGAVTGLRKLKRVCRADLALVGDASGSVDAITGEGMGLAVRQAIALAAAFASDRLTNYEQAHREIGRRPAMMAELLLLLSRHERLQRPAISCLAMPGLFDRLLALHVAPIRCCAPAS